MKDMLRHLLDEMKDKVLGNLKVVKENEVDIRQLLTNPDTYERAFTIQLKYKYNRKLLHENLEFLDVQQKVVNLVSKYGQTDFMKTPFKKLIEQIADIDYVNETIDGNMTFDENHPYYRDEEFIDLLLQHYISSENYEECNRLNAIKEKVKN